MGAARVVLPGEELPGGDAATAAHAVGADGAARPLRAQTPLPAVGAHVTCRVARVTPRLAALDVLCVGGAPLPEGALGGVLRKQDVVAKEVDSVDMHASFRAGDVVAARVLSLGDARAYYLGTAEPQLGVVMATSAATGLSMAADADAMEMVCEETGLREPRKVARLA
eukprot:PRCOL_00002874-RA